MGYALEVAVTLETLTCGGCGITFAIPNSLYQQYVNSGVEICCPNTACPWGGMVCRETEVKRLQRELTKEKARTERAHKARQWAEKQRDQAEYRRRAAKGQVTKLRKRAAAGVCPCCNRSFENLRRHMESKHPGFVETKETDR